MSRKRKTDTKTSKKNIQGVIIVAVIAALSLGGYWMLQEPQSDAMPLHLAKASGTMTIGRDDAPITVIEYSDFQCPFCGIFARDIQPRLIEEYVNTGLVRFEWRNFPIFGQFSNEAALGSYCAHEQGEFWAYHDALYNTIRSLSQADRNVDALVRIADSIALDTSQFRACVQNSMYQDEVLADYQAGRALNIVGTPSFTINGMLFVGAQPIENWQQVFSAFSE